MKYCCDCAYMDTNEGEGKNIGKYPCTNKRIKDKYVSARKVVRGGDYPFCPGFLEAFSTRGEWEREQYMKESKRHGYYVLTAIKDILGLDEHEVRFNKFVYLRDVIMPKLDPKFVSEYEFYGPILADELKSDDFSKEAATYYLTEFVYEVINCIDEEKYERAIEIYKSMINSMKLQYLEDFKVIKLTNSNR